MVSRICTKHCKVPKHYEQDCRSFSKVCGNLILRTLVLRVDIQLKKRYLCKAKESQSAYGSGVNIKMHENAISK